MLWLLHPVSTIGSKFGPLKLPQVPWVCGLPWSCEVCNMPTLPCLYLCTSCTKFEALQPSCQVAACLHPLPFPFRAQAYRCASRRLATCQLMLLPEPAGLAWQAMWPATAEAPVWQAAATVPAVPTATLLRSVGVHGADIAAFSCTSRDLCVAALPQHSSHAGLVVFQGPMYQHDACLGV